jgi:hypothetical protein
MIIRGRADRRIELLTRATLRARAAANSRQETRMKIEERVAEIQATITAILEDESGWPSGYWDPTIKMLEARAAVLMVTDAELRELSNNYKAEDRIGTTAKELMAEVARRSRLTAHERMAEAVARERTRS